MGSDVFEVAINMIKMVVLFLLMVQVVPILVWVERRGSAYIQNRFGPNRVGPFGLTQLIADAVKFIFKEEFVPSGSRAFLFYAAPVLSLVPAGLALAALPLASPINLSTFDFFGSTWGPYTIQMQGFNIGIGIVFILGVSSLGAYGMLMAGWASANKYSLFGALRACAQMISYELGLGLSIVGILMVLGTFDFNDMITAQASTLSFKWFGELYNVNWLPNWGLFYQPIGAFLFFVCTFAETNRAPFDLPEAEAELVAGYHTEYGGLKMNMFYIGEYGHMIVASALFSILFLGGYAIPFVSTENITEFFLQNDFAQNSASILTAVVLFHVMLFKIIFLLWVFIWVRWTLPRFRYDQLMDLGWKTILPWALANTIVTAIFMHIVGS